MKVTLDLPEVEGYEYTGEYRKPVTGEYWLGEVGGVVLEGCEAVTGNYFILKKKKPEYLVGLSPSEIWEKRSPMIDIKAVEDLMGLLGVADHRWDDSHEAVVNNVRVALKAAKELT
jgi:hypothetical protein